MSISSLRLASFATAAYDRSKKNAPSNWVDLEEVKPCCGDVHWLVAAGMTIPGVGACGSSSCQIGSTSSPTTSTTLAPTKAPTNAPTTPGTTPAPTKAPISDVTACASGNDDTGKKCPPDTKNGPCPAGCEPTSTSSPTPASSLSPTRSNNRTDDGLSSDVADGGGAAHLVYYSKGKIVATLALSVVASYFFF